MGFGISGLIQKYTRAALIRYNGSGTQYFLEGYSDENAIYPDVKKGELHKYQSNITQQALEDGSIVSEHIIQQPITISLQFEETNNTFGVRAGDKLTNRLRGPTKTFDQLVEIWKNKIVCQVITEHKIYNNMVIQNMPIQHQAPYKGSLQIQCEFSQLNFATPAMSIYIGKDAGLTESASKTISGGQKQMKVL